MAFVEVAANSDSGAYEIENSVRYNQVDSPQLKFEPSSDMASRKTMTWSFWCKRSVLNGTGAYQFCMAVDDTDNGFNPVLRFNNSGSGDTLRWSGHNESTPLRFITNVVFKDPAAWYHIVVMMDTTQSTNTDRLKLYVNGVQTTDFSEVYYGSQNDDTNWGKANSSLDVGFMDKGSESQTSKYFDGYLADFYYINAQNLAASDFGEFNDNGVWIPKKYAGSFNSDSFKLEFKQTGTSANASGIGADTSGNGNHLTVANLAAGDITTDTPSNNFATLNPLMAGRGSTLSEGNCKVSGESDNNYDISTFGTDMKFYFEWKLDEAHSGGNGIKLSVMHIAELEKNDNYANFQTKYVKTYTNSNDGKYQDGNGQNPSGGGSLTRATSGDIIMVACDGGNGKVWFGVNGTWLSSGDPENGTGGFHGSWSAGMETGIYFACPIYSVTNGAGQINFGNPSFSISSGNSDANGYGNFEYAVPGGFYALCTKNLAEYG